MIVMAVYTDLRNQGIRYSYFDEGCIFIANYFAVTRIRVDAEMFPCCNFKIIQLSL